MQMLRDHKYNRILRQLLFRCFCDTDMDTKQSVCTLSTCNLDRQTYKKVDWDIATCKEECNGNVTSPTTLGVREIRINKCPSQHTKEAMLEPVRPFSTSIHYPNA